MGATSVSQRKELRNLKDPLEIKELNSQLGFLYKMVYGGLPKKALTPDFQNEITDKVDNTTFQTSVTQTAEQIELLATKEEVNNDLGDLADDLEALTTLVDGSMTIWYSATDPAGKATYDIWFRTTPTPYLIQRWMGTVYVDISSTSIARALQAAYSAQTVADGKIKLYRQATAPTGLTASDDGDLWIDTAHNNKLWAWNGTTLAWVSAQDTHLDETVTTHTTQISQNATAIALKADQTTVNALGTTVSSLSSALELVPGQITAEVTNKTHHYGVAPPDDADMYVGKVWVVVPTNEQVYWSGVLPITEKLRSYSRSVTGVYAAIPDLSDDVELDVTVKTVAAQAGSGTPSPSNVRAISGKSAITVRRTGKNLFDPGATVTTSGITKTVNADGSVTLSGTASADVFFNMDLLNTVPGNMMLSANNPAANANVAIRCNTASGTQVYGLALSSINAVSTAFSGDVRRVSIRINNGTVLSNFVFYPQLEMGSSVTTFEAYAKTDYTLTPDSTLYGLTGYEDEITTGGAVTHKTAYVALDNTWTASVTALTTNVRAVLSKAGVPAGISDNSPAICSHFDRVYSTGDTVHFYKSAGYVNLYIPKTSLSTYDSAGVLAWLQAQVTAGTPVQVVFQRASNTTATVAPVAINGTEGSNTVTSDGSTVTVAYTGSGWALVSGNARRLYSSSYVQVDENGLEITQTSIDGTPIEVKYIANTQQSGHFRISDGKQLSGLKRMVDDNYMSIAGGIMDPESDGSAYIDVVTETEPGVSTTSLQFKGVSYDGATDPNPSSPSMEPDQTGTVVGVELGFETMPEWNGTTYEDVVRAFLTVLGELTIHGQQLYVAAVNTDGSAKCGISFDAEGDSRIRTWGSALSNGTIYPSATNTWNLGTPDNRWKYVYSNNALQTPSDERIKRDFTTLDRAAELIMALNPFAYRYTFDEDTAPMRMGFGAGATEAALAACGMFGYALINRENPDELGMAQTELIAPLVSVVQQQQRRLDELERKLEALTSDLK